MSLIDRRKFAGLALASVAAGQFATQPLFAKMTQGVRVNKPIDQLEAGEFTWHPERQKRGPVAIIVSIPDQMVHVYRGGVRIAVSTCSTGRKGHSTPTGVFTILQKDKHHRSSTYNNAPMPNMNRLTWSGIALHAGNLPGYPGLAWLHPAAGEVLPAAVHRHPPRHAGHPRPTDTASRARLCTRAWSCRTMPSTSSKS
jgi:hypothetical protein